MTRLTKLLAILGVVSMAAFTSVLANDPYRGKIETDLYPNVVSLHLFEGADSYCSAVVIEEGVLLTAAHCKPFIVDAFVLLRGDYHAIKEWHLPDQSYLNGDLAVIFIDPDHKPIDYILPIGKETLKASDMGRVITQVGFGHGTLRATYTFDDSYFGAIAGTDWFTWAGIASQVNPGDSGGAVMWYCPIEDRIVLMGITTAVWRNRWSEKVYINIAVRLDIYTEWIDETIRDYQERTARADRGVDSDSLD